MQVPHKCKAIILTQESPTASVCVHLAKIHTLVFFFKYYFFLLLQQILVFHAAVCLQTEPMGLYGE